MGFLAPGVGHIYLGVYHPGILIFVIGVLLKFIVDKIFPFPLNWIIFGFYWGWALLRVYKIYKIITGPAADVI
ncbi:MAG TPA: hypothetical protein VJS91_05915 [Nitrososphaeraceae archaeon]|nr:hypothetical protein [Nitrososphaeraceae archaeon]